MSNKLILNFDNTPFLDISFANQTAAILTRENEALYKVIECENGFAIVTKNQLEELYLRPALRRRDTHRTCRTIGGIPGSRVRHRLRGR